MTNFHTNTPGNAHPHEAVPTHDTDPASGLDPTVRLETDTVGHPGAILAIGWDDLTSPEVDAQVQRMREAQSVPLVRSVGEPEDAKPAWYRGQIVQMSIAGLIGGLLAWAVQELVLPGDSVTQTSELGTAMINIGFTMLIGLSVGIVLASWEGVFARSWAKIGRSLRIAGPVLIGTTLAGGFLAHVIYTNWTEAIWQSAIEKGIALDWTDAQFFDYVTSQLHLPRGVAWAVVGLAAGIGLGIASRASQRIINGAIGGVIGGFAGGALFDFFTSGVSARLVGIAITGAAIGLAIGLVEVARRQHWLEIVTGGMAGKQFILYTGATTLGSSPECDVTLIKDPGIAPVHARLDSRPEGLQASSTDPSLPALVNGAALGQQTLRDGDMLQLGSTMLRYRDKAEQQVVDGPIAG